MADWQEKGEMLFFGTYLSLGGELSSKGLGVYLRQLLSCVLVNLVGHLMNNYNWSHQPELKNLFEFQSYLFVIALAASGIALAPSGIHPTWILLAANRITNGRFI